MFARDFVHSPQNRLLGDTAAPQRQQKFHVADVLAALRRFGHVECPFRALLACLVVFTISSLKRAMEPAGLHVSWEAGDSNDNLFFVAAIARGRGRIFDSHVA
jgi:hypothetical protein